MTKHRYYILIAAIIASILGACNEKIDDGTTPEPDKVTSLDLTVTGEQVQAPYGNVYLFYSEDVDLDYALGYGDGKNVPLIDVSQKYNPVVKYTKDGEMHTLHPVSSYGTVNDGSLDNFASVRYSQIHFDITRLDKCYGTVQKGSVVLVVIVLNDPQTKSWVARTMQLRRDHLVHVSLPDNKDVTYVTGNELHSKWWQVDE